MSEVDDVRLLERARRGDEDAFSQLFGRYQRVIYRYAAYMCGRDSGDDIVQETFLAVLRQTGRDDAPRGTVGGYLFGIARHMVMKRRAARKDEPVDDSLSDSLPAEQANALEDLTRAETVEAVRAAVQSLPPAYREVVVLCEFQEMDNAGAADIMQCPVGIVRSRLHHDPRTGDIEHRLTNIKRAEPARALFNVPSNYTIVDGPQAAAPPPQRQ